MKLSVAMITYNHEHFIGQAIESVLAQKVNFDYEIVIGEDNSTDGTRAVILDFQRRYPDRILPILRESNIGGLQNIESTLAVCRGRYVAILEGDDYWTSVDKLQRQVEFLEAHPDCAISCHRVRFINESGRAESEIFPPFPAGSYTIDDLLKGNFVMTCSAVLRRDLTGPLPACFSTMKVGDWPRYVLAARHRKIELMDEIMASYRVHSGSMWSSMSQLARYEDSSQMLKALDKCLGYEHTTTIRQTLAGFYLEMASISRQQGRRMETTKHVISCIRNGGWQLPGSRRTFASLAAYVLTGSWYKISSRAKQATKADPSFRSKDPRNITQ